MELTVAQTHVGIFAACIGLLQSTAWFFLSITCIVWHFGGLTFPTTPTSYQELWEKTTYSRFLLKELILTNKEIATPTTITVFCFIYVYLCGTWCTFSCLLAWGIKRKHDKLPLFFRLWGCNTCMVTLADLVLLVVLWIDYVVCIKDMPFGRKFKNENELFCVTEFIPVMTIVARGFVLIFVNVAFCIYAIQIGKQLGIMARQDTVLQSNPCGAISSSESTIPMVVVQQIPDPDEQYQYPPSGSNLNQNGQPQNWDNSFTDPTYPPQELQVY